MSEDFEFKFEKILSVSSHDTDSGDLEYWLSRSDEERFAGIEFLRRQFYDYGKAERELHRFFEVIERA